MYFRGLVLTSCAVWSLHCMPAVESAFHPVSIQSPSSSVGSVQGCGPKHPRETTTMIRPKRRPSLALFSDVLHSSQALATCDGPADDIISMLESEEFRPEGEFDEVREMLAEVAFYSLIGLAVYAFVAAQIFLLKKFFVPICIILACQIQPIRDFFRGFTGISLTAIRCTVLPITSEYVTKAGERWSKELPGPLKKLLPPIVKAIYRPLMWIREKVGPFPDTRNEEEIQRDEEWERQAAARNERQAERQAAREREEKAKREQEELVELRAEPAK